MSAEQIFASAVANYKQQLADSVDEAKQRAIEGAGELFTAIGGEKLFETGKSAYESFLGRGPKESPIDLSAAPNTDEFIPGVGGPVNAPAPDFSSVPEISGDQEMTLGNNFEAAAPEAEPLTDITPLAEIGEEAGDIPLEALSAEEAAPVTAETAATMLGDAPAAAVGSAADTAATAGSDIAATAGDAASAVLDTTGLALDIDPFTAIFGLILGAIGGGLDALGAEAPKPPPIAEPVFDPQ